ncbi:MAG: rod shape-determining protein RodA [Ignavibacteriales bacterium]|nr:rod shape-determining protein RodA [Ignavibacteriales bacterium]
MNASFKEYFDYKSLGICLALVVIGLVSIYSATFDINNAANFGRQVVWAVAGLVALLVAAFFPLKSIQRLAIPLYVVTLVFLLFVLIIGKTTSGSKSWFGLGGFGMSFKLQPSEFAKVITVLAFAAFLSKTTVSLSNMKHLIIGLAIFAVPMGFVLAQPDLGTSVIFFGAMIPLLYWAGASRFMFAAVLAPILVAFGALLGTTAFLIAVVLSALLLYVTRENYFAAALALGITLAVGLSVQIIYERLPTYQRNRIATFLDPGHDPLGAGYNVLQAKVAIGSGGFLGKGYMKGTQTQLNFIPEQWTDFIFCVPGEEFGLLGASVVLVLFAALLFHGIKIGELSKNKFGSLAAIGITAILATHVFINIGMSMGLMPVIGIPLPFLSYGGSSLVSNMIMVGLLMNVYANRKSY